MKIKELIVYNDLLERQCIWKCYMLLVYVINFFFIYV